MRTMIPAILAAALATACNDPGSAATNPGDAPSSAATPVAQAPRTAAATAPAAPSLDGRTGELVNPDDATMILLYHDLAGITSPVETWVERDFRVMQANGADKAKVREVIRQELAAGAAAVRGAGRIRMSLNGRLSDYDPAYGEFTVRALAPSSVIEFSAFQEKVALKFGNGRTAQIWPVPESEAQAIADRLPPHNNVALDVLLRIIAVQPGIGGGTLVADILEYEMREPRSGTTIGRVTVASE